MVGQRRNSQIIPGAAAPLPPSNKSGYRTTPHGWGGDVRKCSFVCPCAAAFKLHIRLDAKLLCQKGVLFSLNIGPIQSSLSNLNNQVAYDVNFDNL